MEVTMEALVTNKRVLQWICAYPLDENSNKWIKYAFALFIFASNVIGVITSGAFVWKFVATDLESSLYALIQVAAFLSATYIFVIAFVMRHEITATINQLSDIYNKYKNDDSFQYLARANDKCEWMWPMFFKCVIGGFFVTTPLAAVLIFIWFVANGSFNVNDVYHPLRFILPWNQSTIVGYAAEIVYGLNPSETFYFTNGALMLLFISICLHHQAFYEMFRHSVRKLDGSDKDRHDEEILCDLVRLHITVKDWFFESAKVYSPLIVVELICAIIFTSCIVFELDLVLKHIDYTLCVLLLAFVHSISTLFLYCFFGNSASQSYEGMADCLYNANWYELPVKLQKYFIIMVANTQKPLYYEGFGIAFLNVETFLKVLRSVYTFYMLFKTISSDSNL